MSEPNRIEQANIRGALKVVEKFRGAVEAGDGDALLSAIQCLVSSRAPFPLWLAAATFQAIDKYKTHAAATLDEAFGVERPRRYRQAKARELETTARNAIADIVSLRMLGLPVSGDMFEAVGGLHAAGKTKVSEWYYGDPAYVRQIEKIYGWTGPQMRDELERVAESLGYRASQFRD